MFSGKADDRLRVQIPASADDHPSWTKVSVITAVGFIVGVAWPHLAGVRLGPSLPADAPSAMAAGAAASASGALPAAAPTSSPAVPAAASVPVTPPAAVAVNVGHGAIFACRSSDGATLKGPDCGPLPGLDALVTPRLRKLAECPEAASAAGKLHLVAHPDFARGALSLELGKGPNVAPADALLTCAKIAVAGASLTGLGHDSPRYSVAYVVTFAPAATAPSASPGEPGPSAEPRAAPDDGDAPAQVVWEVAIVRDAPKIGKVVARLQRGSAVHLGAAKDGWYPVKFGDGFASDGWLYRGAIGK